MTQASTSITEPNLWIRALWAIGALVIYALGTHIPLPGVNMGVLAVAHLGVGIERLSVFAIGLIPLLSVLLVLELLKSLIPPFGRWATVHAMRLRLWVVLAALLMAAFQARNIAYAMESIPGLVDEPGPMFRVTVLVTLVGATAFLAWLGARITASGLGNGLWILLIVPVLFTAPVLAWGMFDLMRMGAVDAGSVFAALAFFAGSFVLLAAFAPPGGEALGALPIDVWPALLASYVAGPLMLLIARLSNDSADLLRRALELGHPARLLVIALLILAFTQLRASFAPGAQDRGRMWRLAGLQVVICIVGELLMRETQLPFETSGPWTIVTAAVILGVVAELRAPRAAAGAATV